jgi:hypothetical protein
MGLDFPGPTAVNDVPGMTSWSNDRQRLGQASRGAHPAATTASLAEAMVFASDPVLSLSSARVGVGAAPPRRVRSERRPAQFVLGREAKEVA